MAQHYELRYWSNGYRTVKIFTSRNKAEKCASMLYSSIRRAIVECTTTSQESPVKFFRELRKARVEDECKK